MMTSVPELQNAQPLLSNFSVLHQKVELDIDLPARRLKGRTEILISPHSKDLKVVRLNCRQCDITRITANNKQCSNFVYDNPYSKTTLRWDAGVHQHHLLRRKIEGQLKSPPDEELVINLPKSLKIEELDPFSIAASTPFGARSSVGLNSKEDHLGEASSARTAVEQDLRYKPFSIVIDFAISHIRDGMQFVGWEPEDLRYPHAYTRSFSAPGGVCCLFPCVDSLAARCTWELSIKCSKTIGDALSLPQSDVVNGTGGGINGVLKAIVNPALESNMSAEDKALEFAVICTGDLTDEVL